MICEEYVVIPTYHHHFLCWFLLPHQHGSEVHTTSHWEVSRLAYQCDDQTRYGPVTYRLKVCSCMPCSFSISTRYSPSSSCFTLEKPRMILSGPAVQLLHLGSVARSLEHCRQGGWGQHGATLDVSLPWTMWLGGWDRPGCRGQRRHCLPLWRRLCLLASHILVPSL